MSDRTSEAGAASPERAEEVLAFWFDEVAPERRFRRDDALDREIGERFAALHTALARGVEDGWLSSPRNMLAAIVVLDQFSRNLFRDDPRAFAQDAAALDLAMRGIAAGFDHALTREEKQFLYMPLMHSEVLADVERCAELMHAAGHAEGEDFARRHAAVVARFGRYPGRNAALGRQTTPEEAYFLADASMGF